MNQYFYQTGTTNRQKTNRQKTNEPSVTVENNQIVIFFTGTATKAIRTKLIKLANQLDIQIEIVHDEPPNYFVIYNGEYFWLKNRTTIPL